MERLRSLAGRTRRAAHRLIRRTQVASSPRSRSVNPALRIADELPRISPDMRAGQVERFMQDLRQSLEVYPHGWQGDISPQTPLAERVASVPWYHTIELPGGIVTPGRFDHRPLVAHYGIPDDLTSKRVLDVGPWDGFWSFELERRGAHVVAVDIDRLSSTDLPAPQREALLDSGLDQRLGGGFELARAELGSSVERVTCNIYDVDPHLLGTFDLVHLGDVLQHLERPTAALRALRSVVSDSGEALMAVAYDPALGDRPIAEYRGGWHDAIWWLPSLTTVTQWVADAGFDPTVVAAYKLRGAWRAVLRALPR